AAASTNTAAAYPYVKVTDMLDHSKSFDELDPEKRKALEGFVPLIAQDLTVNHLKPEEIIDRISARGFSRKAVEQVVRDIAQQPIRAPIRYEQKLTQEQFESLPSPWLTMWTNPRETIRRVVYYDPKRDVLLLAALQGFVSFFGGMLYIFLLLVLISNDYVGAPGTWESDLSNLPSMSFTALAIALGICATIGPISGLIGLYLYGWLFRVTGRWLGGNAYPIEVRAAIAWSAVPQIWGTILQALKLVLIVYVLYANAINYYISSSALLATLGISLLVESIIGIWSLVVLIKSLGEVHSFSAWKALGAVLLAMVIVSVVNIVISCILNVMGSAVISALVEAYGY
ncbi:MAG: Yip1 family protein, partial [Anaerolineae bacterium]